MLFDFLKCTHTMRRIRLKEKEIPTLKLDFYGDALKLIGYIKKENISPEAKLPISFSLQSYLCTWWRIWSFVTWLKALNRTVKPVDYHVKEW